MSRYRIPVNQVINDFIVTLDTDDYANDVPDTSLRVYALRGIREMGFDMSKSIRSLKLPLNSSNMTVELPDDFVDLIKIGFVSEDGLVYVMGENKNLNQSQRYKEINGVRIDSDNDGVYDRVDSKGSTDSSFSSDFIDLANGFGDYVFRNYIFNNSQGGLYGIGGGQYMGEYRVNYDQDRIEIGTNVPGDEFVIEYICDEARSQNPTIHVYAEEALRAYIYYKIVEKKSSVPANEKMRARTEYYNERRKANARIKSFTKEEALKTIRKNFKQSPKA